LSSIFNRISLNGILILNLLNIFYVYHRAPAINEKMPIRKEKIVRRNKNIGMINIIILIILSFMMSQIRVVSIIIWTITIQTMLMFNKRAN